MSLGVPVTPRLSPPHLSPPQLPTPTPCPSAGARRSLGDNGTTEAIITSQGHIVTSQGHIVFPKVPKAQRG